MRNLFRTMFMTLKFHQIQYKSVNWVITFWLLAHPHTHASALFPFCDPLKSLLNSNRRTNIGSSLRFSRLLSFSIAFIFWFYSIPYTFHFISFRLKIMLATRSSLSIREKYEPSCELTSRRACCISIGENIYSLCSARWGIQPAPKCF